MFSTPSVSIEKTQKGVKRCILSNAHLQYASIEVNMRAASETDNTSVTSRSGDGTTRLIGASYRVRAARY
jgi:hypothetical protein